MKKILSFIFLMIPLYFIAQNDCVDAIVVCGNSGYEDLSAVGVGTQELSSSNTCGSQENNSVWFDLRINTGGTLGFTLTPTNVDGSVNTDIGIDFDFFIFGPNASCGNIGQAIRCSTTNPQSARQGNNLTGMNGVEIDSSEGPGPLGNSFVRWLNVTAGQTYFLVIDRPIGNSNFRIDWTGTATFNEPPTAEPPAVGTSYDLEKCDYDGVDDGTTEFSLSSNTLPLIGSQSGVDVSYHTSNTHAQVGSEIIQNPTMYRNTSNPQTIYARIVNLSTGCYVVDEFELIVLASPTIDAPDINMCDDNNDGVWNFDLTQSDVDIINGQTNVTVSYYRNETDANNLANPILGLYPNASNPQTLWARIENTTTGCYEVDSFSVEVFDAPVAGVTTPYELCDDNNDGSMSFDLTTKDSEIFNGQSTADFQVYYFDDVTLANEITGTSLTDFVSSGQTIYAKIQSVSNSDCFDTTSFDLIVYESAMPLNSASIDPIIFCDNNSFGSDSDGRVSFNLKDKITEILNGQSVSDFELTFFKDAAYTNQISENTVPVSGNDISDYYNELGFNDANGEQTIYVRVTNVLTNNCYTDTSFKIKVNALPVVNTPQDYNQCDDASNDKKAFFNLSQNSIKEEIYSNHAADNIVFTYYEQQSDAEAGGTPTIVDPSNYENTSNPQTIWVRIENPEGCFRVVSQELTVELSSVPLDNYNPVSVYQCDDGTDIRDGVATFNLTQVHDHIRDVIFNTATVTVDFYESQSDAELENNEITDIANHQNTNSPNVQDIWVRVKNDLGNTCLGLRGFSGLLNVEELPMANTPTTLQVCNDDHDNPAVFPFDTSTVTNEVLGNQTLADVTITYFNEDGTPIATTTPSNLPNPFITASQTIEIVVTNNSTNDIDGPCSETTFLEFIVDDLPEAIAPPLDFYTVCDDDNDGKGDFDTATLESDILNGQTGMNVYYFDATGVNPLLDENGVAIVSPFPNNYSTVAKTINVVVENPINNSCQTTVTVNFTVNQNPIFDLLEEDIVCENFLPHAISVENPDQNDYLYQWYDSNNNQISAPDGANQFLLITSVDDITESGVTYSVVVTNPVTGCETRKEVLLKKSSIAIISDDDIVKTEFSSPDNSIEIITENLGSGDYEFALEHETDNWFYQDEPIFMNLLGGVYTVFVRDKNNCGEVSHEVVLIDYPKFLTPNNDGENDTWQLMGLESQSFTVSPIQIFNRYGEVMTILNPYNDSWDGYSNGNAQPSSDYWFTLQLTDSDGKITNHQGHFSLVRK